MMNIQVTYDVKDEGEIAPVGYQEIGCYPIFDIKATTLTHKGRFVAGGHKMDKPAAMIYASVISRESVRIALLVADLNKLDVFSDNVHNTYLNAPPREKSWLKSEL